MVPTPTNMQPRTHYSRPPRDPADEISPVDGARVLGISRTAMYRLMAAMERYVQSPSGALCPLPDEYRRLDGRHARAAWRRSRLIVISEWGAESMAGADWRISRLRLTAWAHTHGHSIPTLLH